jgi:hypothetical protein
MIIWAYSWPSIVATTGRDCFIMKSDYGCSILRCKGYVRTCLGKVAQSDPEESLGTDAIARVLFGFRV